MLFKIYLDFFVLADSILSPEGPVLNNQNKLFEGKGDSLLFMTHSTFLAIVSFGRKLSASLRHYMTTLQMFRRLLYLSKL